MILFLFVNKKVCKKTIKYAKKKDFLRTEAFFVLKSIFFGFFF